MPELNQQLITFIGVNIGLFAALASLVVWTVNKHDARLDKMDSKFESHSARIDQLYKMFVDLLKEKK
jgi:hypothetical protein